MDIGIVSKRYAKALYAFAAESQLQQTVYDEMQQLLQLFARVPGLRQAIENPVVTRRQKMELLCHATNGAASEPYRRFVALVLNARREKFLQFMAISFVERYRQKHHIHIGRLTTATTLAAENLEQMKQLVTDAAGGTVEFETAVDPSLIGGFILDVNFERLDASIAWQLSQVQRQFAEKNKRIV